MTTPLDCIPCLCRETVTAVRRATPDPALQDAILAEALFHLAMRDVALPPPALAADLQALITARTGHPSPVLCAKYTESDRCISLVRLRHKITRQARSLSHL
jgi:uncharacterized protein with ATP-grasp and redox domains